MAKTLTKLPKGIVIPKRGRKSQTQEIQIPGVFNGIQMQPKLPVGQAEHYGLDFDGAFGLGNKSAPEQFKSKIGVNLGFGQGNYDIGFTKAFIRGEFMNEQPALISNNYGEPSEMALQSEINKSVPTVIEGTKKLGLGKRIPLTDDQAKRQRLETKFRRVRAEALATGGNALNPTEKRDFFDAGTYATQNFGTSSKKPVGLYGSSGGGY